MKKNKGAQTAMPRDANSDPGFWLALLGLGLRSDTDGTPLLRTAREGDR